jgi:phosphoribosylformylglycinamidine synthase
VSVPRGHEKAFLALCAEHGVPCTPIGVTSGAPVLEFRDLFSLPLDEARAAYQGTLPGLFSAAMTANTTPDSAVEAVGPVASTAAAGSGSADGTAPGPADAPAAAEDPLPETAEPAVEADESTAGAPDRSADAADAATQDAEDPDIPGGSGGGQLASDPAEAAAVESAGADEDPVGADTSEPPTSAQAGSAAAESDEDDRSEA